MTTRSCLLPRPCFFAFLTCFLLCFSVNAKAIEFVVNHASDAIDANPGDGVCRTRVGFCSLRAAVQETNANPGADVIVLPTGLFALTSSVTDDDKAQTGDLDILDDLIIRGAGVALTQVTGAKNVSRVFSILSNAANANPSVSIEQLTMAEGLENIDGGVVYTDADLSLRNVAVEDAGLKSSAIHALDTSLTIIDSVFERNDISVSVLRGQLDVSSSAFRNNQFSAGAPILINSSVAQLDNNVFSDNQGSGGAGAISAINSKAIISNNRFTENSSASSGSGAVNLNAGTYVLKANVFSGNTSASTGGAISSNASMFVESNSFVGNVSGQFGGAIEVTGLNRVTVIDSFFDSNNAARDCGAMSIVRQINAAPLIVEGSIFRNNTAGHVGGAICFDNNVHIAHSEFSGNVSRTSGGAIYSSGNNSSVVNSTVSGNLAVAGSAVYQKTNGDSRLDIRHVTIADNASSSGNTANVVNETGRIVLAGSIVSANGLDVACSGKIESGGYNSISDNSCALGAQGDTANAVALLGELMPYGVAQVSTEATAQAHLPATGSLVLQAIPTDLCPHLDQAYKSRNSIQCDIGAVQLNGTDVLIGSVNFSEPQNQVNEAGTAATITVSREGGDFGVIGVHVYDTEQGSADANTDYEIVMQRYLEWADGDTADQSIQINLYDDNSEEGTENIQLALAGASGGAVIGGLADTVSLSIIDDETSQSVFAFVSTALSVSEDASLVSIDVIRSKDSVGAASVMVNTTNGSAIAGTDYTTVVRSLNFPAGASMQSFTIPIVDDDEQENDETFLITLSGPTNGAVLGSPRAMQVTIESNDQDTVGATAATITGGSTGSTGATTAGSAADSTGGAASNTTNSVSDETLGSDVANPADDQPEAAAPVSGPAPGTVITVGSARGGGGSSGWLFLCMLMIVFGCREPRKVAC